jgi:hypothetical protein
MVEEAGSALATQLVNAYLTDQLEGSSAGGAPVASAGAAGSVRDLAVALQGGAPSYFRDHDRQFFQVRAVWCGWVGEWVFGVNAACAPPA